MSFSTLARETYPKTRPVSAVVCMMPVQHDGTSTYDFDYECNRFDVLQICVSAVRLRVCSIALVLLLVFSQCSKHGSSPESTHSLHGCRTGSKNVQHGLKPQRRKNDSSSSSSSNAGAGGTWPKKLSTRERYQVRHRVITGSVTLARNQWQREDNVVVGMFA